MDFGLAETWKAGEAQHRAAPRFSARQTRVGRAPRSGLEVQWLGKVDFRFDAVTRKKGPQIVATLSPYDNEMMQVICRRDTKHILWKPLRVEACDPMTFPEPIVKMPKLYAQDRSLYFIHARSDLAGIVQLIVAPTQRSHRLGQVRVIGRYRATIAVRSQALRRIKAPAGRRGTWWFPAMGMSRIEELAIELLITRSPAVKQDRNRLGTHHEGGGRLRLLHRR